MRLEDGTGTGAAAAEERKAEADDRIVTAPEVLCVQNQRRTEIVARRVFAPVPSEDKDNERARTSACGELAALAGGDACGGAFRLASRE